MTRMLWIFLVCASVLQSCKTMAPGAGDSETKVVGGYERKNLPFFASLRTVGQKESFCGGSFLTRRIVLTAAHCMVFQTDPMEVVHGVSSITAMKRSKGVKVIAVAIHPDYNPVIMDNDLALVYLEDYPSSVWPKLVPIGFNQDNNLPESQANSELLAAGFGNGSSYGDFTIDTFMEVKLVPLDLAACQSTGPLFARSVNSRQICTLGPQDANVDVCFGDSGGPLYEVNVANKPTLLGLVSWGDGCAMSGKPGIFTRISSFSKWIQTSISAWEANEVAKSQAGLTDLFNSYCPDMYDAYFSEKGGDSLGTYLWLRATGNFTVSKATDALIKTCSFTVGTTSYTGGVSKDAQGTYRARLQFAGKTYESSVTVHRDYYLNCAEKSYDTFLHVMKLKDLYSGVVTFRGGDYALDSTSSASGSVQQTCLLDQNKIEILGTAAKASGVRLSGPAFGDQPLAMNLMASASAHPHIKAHITSNPSEAAVSIENKSIYPIIAWEFACSTNFSAVTSLGQSIKAKKKDDRFGIAFADKDPFGVIAADSQASFNVKLVASTWASDTPITCYLNGRRLPVEFF